MIYYLDVDPELAWILGALVSVPLLWLSWRSPTIAFLVALGALALKPEVVIGGAVVGFGWNAHHTLLIFALIANALKYGVRLTINWPILALFIVLGLGSLFGNLHPQLTPGYMLTSLVLLALPWAFTQIVMAPGSRRLYAMMIVSIPLISIVIGIIFQLAGIRPVAHYDGYYRLQGAVGIPADLALLAFAGLTVALHESTRPGRRLVGYLLTANLAIVILSGTRMAIVASVVFVAIYAWFSPDLAKQLYYHRKKAFASACVVVGTFLIYLPSLMKRIFEGPMGSLGLSGRDQLWRFYYEEFLLSPFFGRGLGAGFIAAADWLDFDLPTPHNEYLHLLVVGGLLGFVLCLGAIACWFLQLLKIASYNDRTFLLALLPALALYATTENVIILPSIFGLYVYMGVLLTKRLASDKPSSDGEKQNAARGRASTTSEIL